MLVPNDVEKKFGYSITHWFQPIFDLKSNKVLGYEALLRDASSPNLSPVDIFVEAEKKGYRNVLDILSIKNAIDSFKYNSHLLFLNIFPSTLLEKDFLLWWDEHIPPSSPIVLELLENEPINKWHELKAITDELKNRGIKIAIDDMGEGYSFFQQWIELEPDFIKLDRYFAESLSENSLKQKAVKSLIDLFSDTTDVIIEGIEKDEDLQFVCFLGIPYAQGYLLGRPSPKEKLLL